MAAAKRPVRSNERGTDSASGGMDRNDSGKARGGLADARCRCAVAAHRVYVGCLRNADSSGGAVGGGVGCAGGGSIMDAGVARTRWAGVVVSAGALTAYAGAATAGGRAGHGAVAAAG